MLAPVGIFVFFTMFACGSIGNTCCGEKTFRCLGGSESFLRRIVIKSRVCYTPAISTIFAFVNSRSCSFAFLIFEKEILVIDS